MARIRSGRWLAVVVGLGLSLAVVGVQARAAWAGQPVVGGGDLATPVQSPAPPTQPTQPTQPKWPITQIFPGDVLHPPTDPQPPDGPGEPATPTQHPDPQPPTTGPSAKPGPAGGATLVPTPQRIDTGLGGSVSQPDGVRSQPDGVRSQPDGGRSQPGLAGLAVLVLLAAIAVAVLVLASICWRLTRSPR